MQRAALLQEFVTDDTCAMPPNRPPLVGVDASQEFWRRGFSAARTVMETRDRELTISGDLAVDRFNWDQRMTLRGANQTLVDSGSCVWIWRRDGAGVWRISDSISNSDREEPGIWARRIVPAILDRDPPRKQRGRKPWLPRPCLPARYEFSWTLAPVAGAASE
jgi:ketosteroid isomerase-like protein